MASSVSKSRAKRARSREKSAVRAPAGGPVPFLQRPGVGLLTVFLLGLAAVLLLAVGDLLAGREGLGFWLPLAGQAVFIGVSLFLAALFLRIVRPGLCASNARILLLVLAVLSALVPGKIVLYAAETSRAANGGVAGFLLPFAMAPLLVTLLLDSTAGVTAGAWTVLMLSLFAGGSLPLLLTGLVGSVVGAFTVEGVRTRAKVVRTGLVVGLAQIVCVLGLTGLTWEQADVMLVLRQAGACVTAGFFSAIVALLILPLFESGFRITSNISLLELSDLGHPLLQRLAIEAPGTYHHSLVVANLAQAAADAIGANGLLARVCSYFHDVGKLTKPEFFSENIQLRGNPHDDLPPSMSTLVITSHVKEGVSLAMLHKLPPPVLDVIQEHHGTSVLSYFHHKAKTQRSAEAAETNGGDPKDGAAATVDDGEFRYGGPRPTTRESAIIALADGVEAASRSMEKSTPAHIEGLVEDIINTKLLDGQLDLCDLKLSELRKVRNAFVFTLTNMLHGRVPYPKDEDRDKQPAKGGGHRSRENQGPDAQPAAQGRPA
ncbi:MAG: HDIG domain-containing protein [Lentisphaerae bacterium]|nr:HDIG domain-containing protein [Lentisphaerota bacterium]